MRIEECEAPSYRTLRPLRPPTGAGFPVYPDLEDALLEPSAEPGPAVAHVLAVGAGYAYASADVVSTMLARMGLAGNRCRTVSLAVDPMFIRSTAHVVQSHDGRVVLVCYRGTEPMSLVNWLTDADVYPERVRFDFPRTGGDVEVHAGFYRNVRATRFEVLATLQRAAEGRSVLDDGGPVGHSMQALFLTGHSLGGAMAGLMAIMLRTEPAFAPLAATLRFVCTYGQPMIGSPELAAACQDDPFLGRRMVRHVYRDDVVPRLPPTDSGTFGHFGVERRYDGSRWQSADHPSAQLPTVLGLLETPASYLSRRFRLLRSLPFTYSIDDHLPHHYIAALTPPGVPSEFGDAPYAPAGGEG